MNKMQVKEWLKAQDTYTRYKPIVRHHKFRKTRLLTPLVSKYKWIWLIWENTRIKIMATIGY